MYWADKVALELKKRKLQLEWVDDMKTPSGKIHVGSLRGVVVHDLVFKALKDIDVPTKYTYLFENSDPMDDIPAYLPKEKFEQYLGKPLFKVPSPEEGYKDYAEYFALDFQKVMNAVGCFPEIIWTADLYKKGLMNDDIKLCLDKADVIRKIYEELYKKPIANDWFPFQVYCEKCDKVVTTKVNAWDGEKVSYECKVDAVKYTQGCGYKGKVSPFSNEEKIAGKLPWKIEWPVKWKVIGVTVEGAGKDHMSAGGSHDLAKLVCERVLNYPVPYPIPYEFFLIGGKKMSSSKGRGSSASDMLDILPPALIRFLMVKTKFSQQINFDPAGDTIPKLFDDYQKAAEAYFEKKDLELARTFELSQIDSVQKPPKIRFSVLAQWVQMPNMESKIKDEGLEEWAKFARIWVERYAPDSEKFLVSETLPENAKDLNENQKNYLNKIITEFDKEWKAEELQIKLFEWSKEMNLPSKDAFSAIYKVLLGKTYGPKAGWIILSLDKNFVVNRFNEAINKDNQIQTLNEKSSLNHPEIFSIDKNLAQKYPSISVGVAIINNVTIKSQNEELEKEKLKVMESLVDLTTEQLGQYPEVISYRNLYKQMGIDWHSRRPSPEALLRRVALKKGLYNVNTCVDAYNLMVMKHCVSVGAFNYDTVKFPTVLRLAKKDEEILLLGEQEPTKYKETEIAYFDQLGGYNLDFNYRDAQRTAVTYDTKKLLINVDGVYDITPEKVKLVLEETCKIITKYCGGEVEFIGVETANK